MSVPVPVPLSTSNRPYFQVPSKQTRYASFGQRNATLPSRNNGSGSRHFTGRLYLDRERKPESTNKRIVYLEMPVGGRGDALLIGEKSRICGFSTAPRSLGQILQHIRYSKVSGRMRPVGYIGLGLGAGTCLVQVSGTWRFVCVVGVCGSCWEEA